MPTLNMHTISFYNARCCNTTHSKRCTMHTRKAKQRSQKISEKHTRTHSATVWTTTIARRYDDNDGNEDRTHDTRRR